MRFFRLCLFVLVFLLHTGLVTAASVRSCCADQDCPLAQCVAAGCQSSAPAAALPVPAAMLAPAATRLSVPAVPIDLPERAAEVWTPPD